MARKPTRIDIERPLYRAGPIAEIAGFKNTDNITMLRKREGLRIGVFRDDEYRYSILDAAELTAYMPLTTAFAFTSREAIDTCRDPLRPHLKNLLNNRLHHGFWSHGGLVVDEGDSITGPKVLFLDGIGDRVITKLNVPLPDCRTVPPSPVALRMIDAIFNYVESPPGRLRWQRWRTAVMQKGGTTTFDEAAAVLGMPYWCLTLAYQVATGSRVTGDPMIVKAVKPRAPKVVPSLEGMALQ